MSGIYFYFDKLVEAGLKLTIFSYFDNSPCFQPEVIINYSVSSYPITTDSSQVLPYYYYRTPPAGKFYIYGYSETGQEYVWTYDYSEDPNVAYSVELASSLNPSNPSSNTILLTSINNPVSCDSNCICSDGRTCNNGFCMYNNTFTTKCSEPSDCPQGVCQICVIAPQQTSCSNCCFPTSFSSTQGVCNSDGGNDVPVTDSPNWWILAIIVIGIIVIIGIFIAVLYTVGQKTKKPKKNSQQLVTQVTQPPGISTASPVTTPVELPSVLR